MFNHLLLGHKHLCYCGIEHNTKVEVISFVKRLLNHAPYIISHYLTKTDTHRIPRPPLNKTTQRLHVRLTPAGHEEVKYVIVPKTKREGQVQQYTPTFYRKCKNTCRLTAGTTA